MSAIVINIDTSLTDVPTIEVGKQGENGATQVVFDVSEMIETYGSGTAYVVVQRRGDAEPYLLDNTSQIGDKVTWTVSNVDTDVYGTGRVQLFWLINEQVAKTVTYQFYVEEALHDPQDAPVVPGGWISDEIGNLDNLTTTAKANLVAAINEVNLKATTDTTAIGTLANLTTTEKSNLVGAINEVDADVSDVKEDLEALISRGTGLNDTQKALIITILRNALYSSDQSDNIDELEATFARTVTSVSAVIDLGGNTIYTDDTLDTLRQYLTVTATFDDSTSEIVTGYSLSGTLTVGTSTITVTYRDVSSTVSVPVSQAIVRYNITNNLTGVTNSNTDTTIAEGNTYTGVLSAETSGYIPTNVVVTVGGTDVTSTVYDSTTYTISIQSVDGDITITASEVLNPTLPVYELASPISEAGTYDTGYVLFNECVDYSIVVTIETSAGSGSAAVANSAGSYHPFRLTMDYSSGEEIRIWNSSWITLNKSWLNGNVAGTHKVVVTYNSDGTGTAYWYQSNMKTGHENLGQGSVALTPSGTITTNENTISATVTSGATLSDLKIYKRILTSSEISEYVGWTVE